jgi:hypothetical protein
LNAMTMTLKFVVSFEILGLDESFQGTWFGHAFFKTCQYGTTKDFFAKTSNMCPLRLLNQIYKNV